MNIKEYEKYDVVKSNALIEGIYVPKSRGEMRLLMVTLMQIKAKGEIKHTDMFEVRAEYCQDLFGTSMSDNYKVLQRAAKNLRSAYITIHKTPEGKPLEKSLVEINMVAKCEYIKGQGIVRIWFTEWIIPYISSLNKRFTQIQARFILPMKMHSVRLYELLWAAFNMPRHGSKKGTPIVVEYDIDQFRELFGFTSGKKQKYKRVDSLKTAVIEPAIAEINLFTNLFVEQHQRKAGRNVADLIFKVKAKTNSEEKSSKAQMNRQLNKQTKSLMDIERQSTIAHCNRLESYGQKDMADSIRREYGIPIHGDKISQEDNPSDVKSNVENSGDVAVVKGAPTEQQDLPLEGDTPQALEADVVNKKKPRRRQKKGASTTTAAATTKPNAGKGASANKTTTTATTRKKVAKKVVAKKKRVARRAATTRKKVAKKRGNK